MKSTLNITHLAAASVWQAAEAGSFAAAAWRLPARQETYVLVSGRHEPVRCKIELDSVGSGFAFSPFNNPTGRETYFLPADALLKYTTSGVEILAWAHTQLEHELANLSALLPTPVNVQELPDPQQEAQFKALVDEAVAAIAAGHFEKVVLSRTKSYALSSGFSAWQLFERLCQTYPQAFISLVFLPHLQQYWIGASPEVLITQDARGIFSTMALAGTQSAYAPDGTLIKPAEALWRQKEIEEQALVSRYIINCFKQVRVREFEEHGPKTVQAANLMHLRTQFNVDTKAIGFPELGSVMLDLLHPTSAVCGMPKVPATEFILKNEPHQREFFSGYLGPVNVETDTQLYVHLRSMKVTGQTATLYAGCGITIDSDPEKEWLETEMKCQTLGKVLLIHAP